MAQNEKIAAIASAIAADLSGRTHAGSCRIARLATAASGVPITARSVGVNIRLHSESIEAMAGVSKLQYSPLRRIVKWSREDA